MKKNMGSVVLILGIIIVMLSTASLIYREKPKSNIDPWMEEMVRRLHGHGREVSAKTVIPYALLGVGIVFASTGLLISARQRPNNKIFFAIPAEYFGKTMIGFTVARISASALLIWALSKHPYDYYVLLRFVVCGVTAYGVFLAVRFKQITWAWIFGIGAVLFNPIFPIHLERGTWAVIDVCVAVVMMLSIFLFKKSNEGTAS